MASVTTKVLKGMERSGDIRILESTINVSEYTDSKKAGDYFDAIRKRLDEVSISDRPAAGNIISVTNNVGAYKDSIEGTIIVKYYESDKDTGYFEKLSKDILAIMGFSGVTEP